MRYKNTWFYFLNQLLKEDLAEVQMGWNRLGTLLISLIESVFKLIFHTFDILTYSFVCLWAMTRNKAWAVYYAVIGCLLPDGDVYDKSKK